MFIESSFTKEFEPPSRTVAVSGTEEGFYAGMDELSDQDFDDFSDGDDYEEMYMKRKRGSTKRPAKPAASAAAKRQSQGVILDPTVEYKPYVCDFCGVRYKTKPGLNYHLNHSHGVAPGRYDTFWGSGWAGVDWGVPLADFDPMYIFWSNM